MLHAVLVMVALTQDPQGLVTQLGEGHYVARDNAQLKLNDLQATASEFVKRAASSNDPEVRVRAKQIISRWKEDNLWKASATDVSAGTLNDVVTKLCQQTGVTVTLGDNYGTYSDGFISAAIPRQFWPAVDAICKATGNKVRPHYSDRALVLYTGVEKRPIAYNGPFRMCLQSSRVMFSEELDHEDGSSDVSHTFEMRFDTIWESNLNIVAFKPQLEVVRAVTSAGNLLSSQPVAVGYTMLGNARQSQFTLRLHPPANSVTKLDELTVKWDVSLIGDFDYVDIDVKETKMQSKDDIECMLLEYEKAAEKRYTAMLLVTRGMPWEPTEINFSELQTELLDANGVPLRRTGQTNNMSDGGMCMNFTFTSMEENTDPRTLRVHYPRVRSRRDVLFTFKDVKIANGRP